MFLSGCRLLTPPVTGDGPPDWDRFSTVLRGRVKFVASLAFSLEKVQPYKEQTCNVAVFLSQYLENYDDPNWTFEKLEIVVNIWVDAIENVNVRKTVTVVVNIVLNEAFNYAWKHYKNLVDMDEVKSTKIVIQAVVDGLRDACYLTIKNVNKYNVRR